MTLWEACAHGSHFVDLTWGGAGFVLVCFVVGFVVGRFGGRR